jgi:hypothetical protein
VFDECGIKPVIDFCDVEIPVDGDTCFHRRLQQLYIGLFGMNQIQ